MEKQFKFESKIAKLYEVKQSLKKAKEDVEKALIQQDALITIITSSPDKDKVNKEYIDALIADRNVLTAKALAFAESIKNLELLLINYEAEKKDNKKHSSLTTEAVVTLTINSFDLFRDIEKGFLDQVRALSEKTEEEKEVPSEEAKA